MKKLITLLLVSILLSSCEHGVTGYFPQQLNIENSAEIFIIRNKNLAGSAGSAKIMVDGRAIAYLNIGEYVQFQVTQDVHSIGTPESTISIPFHKGEKYYFLLSLLGIGGQGFEVEIIDQDLAIERIENSKKLTKAI